MCIRDRLVGAVAMAFPFAKDPIAGIRPIEAMLRTSSAATPPLPTPAPAAPGQRAAGEAGEYQGFLGADIVEHAEDFDLEVLDFVPVEDSAAGAAHPRFEVFEGKERSLGR